VSTRPRALRERTARCRKDRQPGSTHGWAAFTTANERPASRSISSGNGSIAASRASSSDGSSWIPQACSCPHRPGQSTLPCRLLPPGPPSRHHQGSCSSSSNNACKRWAIRQAAARKAAWSCMSGRGGRQSNAGRFCTSSRSSFQPPQRCSRECVVHPQRAAGPQLTRPICSSHPGTKGPADLEQTPPLKESRVRTLPQAAGVGHSSTKTRPIQSAARNGCSLWLFARRPCCWRCAATSHGRGRVSGQRPGSPRRLRGCERASLVRAAGSSSRWNSGPKHHATSRCSCRPGGRAKGPGPAIFAAPFGSERTTVDRHGTAHHSAPALVPAPSKQPGEPSAGDHHACCRVAAVHREFEALTFSRRPVATVAARHQARCGTPTPTAVFQITDRCTQLQHPSPRWVCNRTQCLVGSPSHRLRLKHASSLAFLIAWCGVHRGDEAKQARVKRTGVGRCNRLRLCQSSRADVATGTLTSHGGGSAHVPGFAADCDTNCPAERCPPGMFHKGVKQARQRKQPSATGRSMKSPAPGRTHSSSSSPPPARRTKSEHRLPQHWAQAESVDGKPALLSDSRINRAAVLQIAPSTTPCSFRSSRGLIKNSSFDCELLALAIDRPKYSCLLPTRKKTHVVLQMGGLAQLLGLSACTGQARLL